MSPISAEMTVKEVLARYPATEPIFHRFGLDSCCGGIHPIGMAAAAVGVDLRALLEELNSATRASLGPEAVH